MLGILSKISKRTFATKMQAGSTNKTKDSAGRRLGVKKFGGEEVFPDEILIRQRGFKWHPGKNTYSGKDHTIHSKIEGVVHFEKDLWRKRKKFYVNVIPRENPNRYVKPPPPYCYHPELFPDRATSNPEPIVYRFPTQKPPRKRLIGFNGIKNDTIQHRLNIYIPEHYLNRNTAENENDLSLSRSSLITEYVNQLEAKYLKNEIVLESQIEDPNNTKSTLKENKDSKLKVN